MRRSIPEGTIRFIDPTMRNRWGIVPERPCVWCGGATDLLALTPFRPDLGAVPMHLMCGAELTRIWSLMQRGSFDPTSLDAETVRRIGNFRALAPGGTA